MLHGYCGVNKVSVTGTQLEVLYDHEDSGIISTATCLLVFLTIYVLPFSECVTVLKAIITAPMMTI